MSNEPFAGTKLANGNVLRFNPVLRAKGIQALRAERYVDLAGVNRVFEASEGAIILSINGVDIPEVAAVPATVYITPSLGADTILP